MSFETDATNEFEPENGEGLDILKPDAKVVPSHLNVLSKAEHDLELLKRIKKEDEEKYGKTEDHINEGIARLERFIDKFKEYDKFDENE